MEEGRGGPLLQANMTSILTSWVFQRYSTLFLKSKMKTVLAFTKEMVLLDLQEKQCNEEL